eukprot:g24233.t1
MGNKCCVCDTGLEESVVRTNAKPVVEDLPLEFPIGHPNKVMLISHQWAGRRHPDPKFEQFAVLQQALLEMSRGNCRVSKDGVRSTRVALQDPSSELSELNGAAKQPIPSMEEQKSVLEWDIWYDYFGCPQIDDRAYDSGAAELQAAVNSIPAYCNIADYVFVLAPSITHCDTGAMMSRSTWGMRGWCRAERTAAVLSRVEKQLLARESQEVQIQTDPSGSKAGGQNGSKPTLFKVFGSERAAGLKCTGDMPSWRFYKALGPRGQGHPEPVEGTQEADIPSFLQRYNMDSELHHYEQGGLSPLMLAGIEGNLPVIRKLIEAKADPNEVMNWDIKDAQLDAGRR